METMRRRVASAFVTAVAVTTMGVAPAGATTLLVPTEPTPVVATTPVLCSQDPVVTEIDAIKAEIARLEALKWGKSLEVAERMHTVMVLQAKVDLWWSKLVFYDAQMEMWLHYVATGEVLPGLLGDPSDSRSPAYRGSRESMDANWRAYSRLLRIEREIIAAILDEIRDLSAQIDALRQRLQDLEAESSMLRCGEPHSWPLQY